MRRSFAAGMLAGFAGLTFAGEANAACKRGLTNVYVVPWAPKIGVCIETRIYGNGAHKRNIRGECS